MKRTIMLACLLGSLAGPALAETPQPPTKPADTCKGLELPVQTFREAAERQHVKVTNLDGIEAVRLLALLSQASGRILLPSVEHITLVEGGAGEGTTVVEIADGVCGGFGTAVTVSSTDAMALLAAKPITDVLSK